MQLHDVTQVFKYSAWLVDKELPLGFEVSKLQRQMHGGRQGVNRCHRFAFGNAQVEIKMPVLFGETRQAIQVIDFRCGQD